MVFPRFIGRPSYHSFEFDLLRVAADADTQPNQPTLKGDLSLVRFVCLPSLLVIVQTFKIRVNS